MKTRTALRENPYPPPIVDPRHVFGGADLSVLPRTKARRTGSLEHVDRVPEARFQKAPAHTRIVVTADRGERVGEAGFFGHGPIMPEQDFEVSGTRQQVHPDRPEGAARLPGHPVLSER
jgi:hypothetical protein